MGSLLADHKKNGVVKITQNTGVPGPKVIAGIDHLLLVLPEKVPATLWRKVPQGIKVQTLMRRKAPGKVPAIATRINNDRQTALHVGTVNPTASAFEMLTFGRKMVAAALSEKAGVIGIWVLGFSSDEQASIVSCVTAGRGTGSLIYDADIQIRTSTGNNQKYQGHRTRQEKGFQSRAGRGRRQQPGALADGATAEQTGCEQLRKLVARIGGRERLAIQEVWRS